MNEADFDRELGQLAKTIRVERGPCPSPEMLVEYVCRSISARDAEAVRDHANACGDCTLALHRLENLDRRLRAPDRKRWRTSAMIAAGALAAALAIFYISVRRGAAEPSRIT